MEEKSYAGYKENHEEKNNDSFSEKNTFRERKHEPESEGKKKPVKNEAVDVKATRLHFEEEDLKDKKLESSARKGEKAADKADAAVDNLPKKTKLKARSDARSGTGAKLKFEQVKEISPKPSTAKRAAAQAPIRSAAASVHNETGKSEDDNVGIEAANESTQFVERTGYAVSDASHFRKLHKYTKAERLMERSDKANIRALYRKRRKEEPQSGNPVSHWMQKRQIKREYAALKRGEENAWDTGNAAYSAANAGQSIVSGTGNAIKESKGIVEAVTGFVRANSGPVIALIMLGGLLMVVMSSFSSCSAIFPGAGGAVIATTYTAEDEDILGAEEDYRAMEEKLDDQINNIRDEYPDYDEYNFHLDEIGHNPFELASYLTVRFENYKREEVEDELRRLFNLQYDLKIEEKVETRSYKVSHTETEADGSTSHWTETVYYEYYILNVTLKNNGLGAVIAGLNLNEDESERYDILMSTYGNKKYLFEDSIYAISGEGESYEIPGEALTDERFANMIREAEKYLGYPYVWGGSSPSTSFDCSGFVSWVINNCGNGWSVGRLTANGLKNICTIIPSSEAKPGDLIFFQGTYNTSGASHVGIYVGDGMMIHCGNPIQYTSVCTAYWQTHFYCYGRLS